MNVSSIHGWNLLSDNKQAQATAKRWLRNAQQSAVLDNDNPKARWSWVDSEIVDGELTGRLTAFAVTLQDGRTILGIAPSLLSARRRTRKLLRHGHCAAAGVPQRQHLN
jgi:hypothetical protein